MNDYDAKYQQGIDIAHGRPIGGDVCVAVGTQFQRVQIERVANGFIVVVGCKTFVATTWAEVAGGLGEYWSDPIAAEKKYSVVG